MTSPPTLDRVLTLLREPPERPDVCAGYLDLLGPSAKRTPSLAQSVMESAFLPKIYERIWRPVGFNLAKGWPVGMSSSTLACSDIAPRYLASVRRQYRAAGPRSIHRDATGRSPWARTSMLKIKAIVAR